MRTKGRTPHLLPFLCQERDASSGGTYTLFVDSTCRFSAPTTLSLPQFLETGLRQSLFELYLFCRPKAAFLMLIKTFTSSKQSLCLPSNLHVALERVQCVTREQLCIFPVSTGVPGWLSHL